MTRERIKAICGPEGLSSVATPEHIQKHAFKHVNEPLFRSTLGILMRQ